MHGKAIIIVLAILVCLTWAAQKESGDMRPAVGGGFSIPTFDRNGFGLMASGNLLIFPFLSVSPELGYGHWNLQTAGSQFLTEDESNRQFWEHHQDMKSQYLLLNLRAYPLTRWISRLSPYILLGAGVNKYTYRDKFIFWGTYSGMSDWAKKGINANTGVLPVFNGGVGLDMPLDKTWSFIYEYRWTYLSGTIGEEYIIATDGYRQAGTLGKKEIKNTLQQYPITISVEVRPW